MRKKSLLKQEAEEVVKRLKEMETLVAEAESEEIVVMDRAKNQINQLCQDENIFCGIILTPEDVLSVIRMMMLKPGENVSIPYNLYFNE